MLGIAISDNKRLHQSWLPARRADLDFFFWKRYKTYLEEIKGWNSHVTGRGDDLFLRDFIYALSPLTDYIGAEDIFGGDEENPTKYKDVLEPIYSIEMNVFFPFAHRKVHDVTELPPSTKEAMAYFLLVNGIW